MAVGILAIIAAFGGPELGALAASAAFIASMAQVYVDIVYLHDPYAAVLDLVGTIFAAVGGIGAIQLFRIARDLQDLFGLTLGLAREGAWSAIPTAWALRLGLNGIGEDTDKTARRLGLWSVIAGVWAKIGNGEPACA
jgi:hypothetical protein